MSIRRLAEDIRRIIYGNNDDEVDVSVVGEDDANLISSSKVEEVSTEDDETISGISLINKLNMIIEGEDIPEDDKEDDEKIDESSSSLDPSIMERIAKKVKYNDYTGALQLAAKMLGSKKLERQFEIIGELQKLDGSLNSNLEKYRMDLSKDIDSIAQRDLSKFDYILFNKAF
jgi:hypothetical protein